MNTFEIFVRILLALIFLYILWHGYVVIVAYRWKQADKLISRALAPRDEAR
jgi:hypothetical protein